MTERTRIAPGSSAPGVFSVPSGRTVALEEPRALLLHSRDSLGVVLAIVETVSDAMAGDPDLSGRALVLGLAATHIRDLRARLAAFENGGRGDGC